MGKRGVRGVSPRYFKAWYMRGGVGGSPPDTLKNISDMVQRGRHEYIETQPRLNGAFARRGWNSHSKRVNKKHSVGKLFLW